MIRLERARHIEVNDSGDSRFKGLLDPWQEITNVSESDGLLWITFYARFRYRDTGDASEEIFSIDVKN